MLRLARREVPAVVRKERGQDLRFAARHPPSHPGRVMRRGKENVRLASETTKRQVSAMYAVKEIYYTLQGEGAQTGRPAVFCRFAGCNLWSGREQDREEAICNFCDTDFVGTDGPGGGKFATPEGLAGACREVWRGNSGTPPYVVLTGGEPMLQVDERVDRALHRTGFEVAIETNGTLPVPRAIDWICVSPKAGAPLVQRSGDELNSSTRKPRSIRARSRRSTSLISCFSRWTAREAPRPCPRRH